MIKVLTEEGELPQKHRQGCQVVRTGGSKKVPLSRTARDGKERKSGREEGRQRDGAHASSDRRPPSLSVAETQSPDGS